MMKASLLTLMIVFNLQGEDPISEFVRKDISNERRDALVEQLKQSDVSTTAQRILKVMRDHVKAGEPGIGSKPWMNDWHSYQAKVWYASGAIWDALFNGRDDPNKTAVLLKLLANNADEYSIRRVLEMMQAHWAPESEAQVFNLLHDSKASISSKQMALEVLIRRCGEKYVISALNFIASDSSRDQPQNFCNMFNGVRFFSFSEENQKNIIDLGFSILEANENQFGYFLARQLGYFLKIPGEFAPDQKAAKYQGEGRLNDQFFLDTVTNALEWRKRNAVPPK